MPHVSAAEHDAPSPEPLLELRGATVLRGASRALDSVDLTLFVGQHAAILGPNGSGKSTLVHLLTGRLYPLASNDRNCPIRILGRERWNLSEMRQQLGVVSADLHQRFVGGSSLGHVTAVDAVVGSFFSSEVVFAHHSVTTAMRAAALTALEKVGAEHLHGARLNEVSTGEARRILIARALVHEPRVLVLDEPTTGLDAVARHDLLSRLRSLAAAGTTLVFITHHLEEVIPETRRVILLHEGRISADGPPEAVLISESVSRAYGAPVHVVHEQRRYSMQIKDPRD